MHFMMVRGLLRAFLLINHLLLLSSSGLNIPLCCIMFLIIKHSMIHQHLSGLWIGFLIKAILKRTLNW